MREVFSNKKEYLIQTMNNLQTDNIHITYEALLLLSIFILMPKRDKAIVETLKKNGKNLINFIEEFKKKSHTTAMNQAADKSLNSGGSLQKVGSNRLSKRNVISQSQYWTKQKSQQSEEEKAWIELKKLMVK